MHPIERLRYVARAGDADPALLAEEAAEALGSLAYEPRALVPACRRLIEFHPRCAPLWWVCARVLTAGDPRRAAGEAIDELTEDPTADELAATFPAGAVVVAGATRTIGEAVAQRPDLTVRMVGRPNRLRNELGRLVHEVEVVGYEPEEADDALDGAQLAVLAPMAAGPGGYLLGEDESALLSAAGAAGVPVWMVTTCGVILPAALFNALSARALDEGVSTREPRVVSAGRRRPGFGHSASGGCSVAATNEAAAVVAPFGAALPAVALVRPGCPVAAELLVPAAR